MREAKAIFSRLKWVLAAAVLVVSQVSPVVFLNNTARAAGAITANTHEGQMKVSGVPGSYSTGNITTYSELDTINFRFNLVSSSAASGQMQVVYSGTDAKCTFFDGNLTLGTWDSSAAAVVPTSGVVPTVTKSGVASQSGGDWIQKLNVTFTGAGSAKVNYFLKLTSDAGSCVGSSTHASLSESSTPGDFANIGSKDVPIPAGDILELPKITVNKYVQKSDGTYRLATTGEWSFALDNSSPTPTDSNGKVIFNSVKPNGTHTITESNGLAGYALASVTGTNCVIGTAPNTATATVQSSTSSPTDAVCNFYNRKIVNPTVTLIKEVVNQYGGTTATPDSFKLTLGGNAVKSGQSNVATIGQTYTVNETQQSGYTFTSITGTGCPTALGGSTVALTEGQNITCTIKNTAIQPKLTVTKIVENGTTGSTKQISDFPLNVNGTSVTSGVSKGFNVGNYTVGETSDPGYSAVFSGDCDSAGKVSLAVGDNKECTITNTAISPTLTLIKKAINDNGGTKLAGSFTLTALGQNFIGGTNTTNGTTTTSSGYNVPGVKIGTTTVSELASQGYTLKSIECKDNKTGLVIASTTSQTSLNISLALAQNATCTLTNDDDTPALTLVKKLGETFGAQVTVSNWNLTATGTGNSPTNLSGATGTAGATSGSNFKTDTYTLGESGPTGFSASWTCIGATGSILDQAITIALGEKVACTVTNTGIQPKLTVTKVVVNGNTGGTKKVSDFALNVSGTPVTSGQQNSFNVGNYTVGETGDSGYSATITGDCNSYGNVSLALADVKACTITNTAIAPKLVLKKVVINNNGGTQTADKWTLTAKNGANPAVIDATGTLIGGTNSLQAETAETTVQANTAYTLSESGPTGYTPSGWSCDGGSLSNGAVTLALGTTVTCTITNDDNTVALTLVKKLGDNLYGATVSANDWTLAANGPGSNDFSGEGTATGTNLSAGNYTLSESSVKWSSKQFTASDWSCITKGETVPILVSESIGLALGDNYTCTITNTAVQPKLTVTKVVNNDNGGTKEVANFPLNVSGEPVKSGATNGFDVGSYTVGETSDEGYSAVISGDCNPKGKVSLALGDNKACTITNTAIAPKLTLHKNVINNNSGESNSSDWTLTATPDEYNKFHAVVIEGNGDDGVVNESAKANVEYTLSEDGPTGYAAGSWSCTGGSLEGNVLTLGLAENVTCEITNNDVPNPDISVTKYGPATAYEGDTVHYTFYVVNTGDTTLNNVSVVDDKVTNVTCPKDSLQPGESMYCTATYKIPTPQVENVVNHVEACGEYNSETYRYEDRYDEEYSQPAVCDTDTHTLDVLHPSIKVVKSGPDTAKAGEAVTYTFTVTNVGDVPLDALTVKDDIAGNGVYQTGDTNNNGALDLTETWIYTANYTIPANATNQVVNTVVACGAAMVLGEEQPSDQIRILRINPEAVFQQPVAPAPVCDDDMHVLNIPAELANTGTPMYPSIFAGLMILGALAAAVPSRKYVSTRNR